MAPNQIQELFWLKDGARNTGFSELCGPSDSKDQLPSEVALVASQQ